MCTSSPEVIVCFLSGWIFARVIVRSAPRSLPLERGNLHSLGEFMLSSERERIAYRVTPLSDIRRVARVKVQKRRKRLTREVALETSQNVIRKKEKEGKMTVREKDRVRDGRCSIITETGNILTAGRGG